MTICKFKNPPGIGVDVVGDRILVDGDLVEVDGQAWPIVQPPPPPMSSIPKTVINVMEEPFNARPGTDATAAIQSALDLRSAPVFIPNTGEEFFQVSQLQVYKGNVLQGAGVGGGQNGGTLLKQLPGSNLSVIVPHQGYPENDWLHYFQLRDIALVGDPNATAGCGIEINRRTGENFLISNVMVNGFAESGIRLSRGSTPGGIFNVGSYYNGQYGFDFSRDDGDVWHQFSVRSVSGDNNGDALIRVYHVAAEVDMFFIDGVKAETTIAEKQQDVIVVDECGTISIQNVTNYSIAPTRSIVRVKGWNTKMLCQYFRATPGCANWIYDESLDPPLAMPRGPGYSSMLERGTWKSAAEDPAAGVTTEQD